MSPKAAITANDLVRYKKAFTGNPQRTVIQQSVLKNGINKTAINNTALIEMQQTFSNEIKTGKVTDQQKSGRCWLFAGLNTFRQQIMQDYNIEQFELSQSYLMFWDKLEKANYFLENILATLKLDVYDRLFMHLLFDPVQDGGQWDMFANLVEKYGIVPKQVMPESFHSGNSAMMNSLLTLKLREYAKQLREKHAAKKNIDSLRRSKDAMLKEVYHLLSMFLGEPPQIFDFEYRDKENNFHRNKKITPKQFFDDYVHCSLDDYISIINAPTQDKPFGKSFTVEYLGNVVGGRDVIYLNVENKILKKLTLDMLKDNRPVWFGCDTVARMDSESGTMDMNLFLYEEALETKFKLDKAGRLDYGESKLNHAMVFTGVNLVNGRPNRWKVENSWGDKRGKEGYFTMSDKWFDEFMYQAVIDKKFLPDELKKAARQKPVVLPPWDPMGSLAVMR